VEKGSGWLQAVLFFMRFRYHNAAGWSGSLVVGEHDNSVAESSVAASVLLNKNSNIAMRTQECHVLLKWLFLLMKAIFQREVVLC
jgi:hypothetical protein